MSVPLRAKIGLSWWSIEWSKEAVGDILDTDEPAGGASSMDSCRMAVEPLPQAPILERSILLHELLHSVWGTTGLDGIGCEHEEQVVTLLAMPLLAVLRENPAVVEYLLSEESA